MKIILSRKGFDGSNGGCPSPVIDNTLLSMPIPSNDNVSYNDLEYKGISYLEILNQINPKNQTYTSCHLDPDIRRGIRKNECNGWMPAFGQTGSAQGMLRNAKVDVGDIFLFFGWYHKAVKRDNKYVFAKKKDCDIHDYFGYHDFHAIWGYMQIGEIITNSEKIKDFLWHPHSSNAHLKDKNNAIYIPSKTLSFDETKPGYGTLDYREDRILTKKGMSKSQWIPYKFLMPDKVYGNKKNSSKKGALYYQGIWQELVVYETEELLNWVRSILN